MGPYEERHVMDLQEEARCWIVALIAPEVFDAVRERLLLIDIADITASHAMGFERSGGQQISYRGVAAIVPRPRVRLEIGCARSRVESVVAAIRSAAGRIHAGATQNSAALVMVFPVDDVAAQSAAPPMTGSFRAATSD